jgi:hypothetical protein
MAFVAQERSYNSWPPHVMVIVLEWGTGRELYRVQLGDLLTKQAPANYELTFALDRDGTVAVDMMDYMSDVPQGMLLWASLAEPIPHRLPGVTSNVLAVAIHDHLIAVRRERDWAILDLKGDVVEEFDGTPFGRGRVAFDGRRVVWGNGKKVLNEPFPVVAAAEPAARVRAKANASIPVRCTAARRCTGKVVLATNAGRKLGARRFIVPSKKKQTITVKLAASARRTLARRGSIPAIARLSARSTGIDVRADRGFTLRR